MNNLTQTQQDAKKAYLDGQAAKMLAHYQTADQSERAATIRQINGFLKAVPPDAKRFWLKFRQKLKRLNEQMI